MDQKEYLKYKNLKKSKRNPLLNSLANMLSKNLFRKDNNSFSKNKSRFDSVKKYNFYKLPTEGDHNSEKKYMRYYSKKRGSLRARNQKKFINKSDFGLMRKNNNKNSRNNSKNIDYNDSIERNDFKRGSVYDMGNEDILRENQKLFFAELINSKNSENLVSITKKTKNFKKKTKDEKFEEWEEMIKLNLKFKQKEKSQIKTKIKNKDRRVNIYSQIKKKKKTTSKNVKVYNSKIIKKNLESKRNINSKRNIVSKRNLKSKRNIEKKMNYEKTNNKSKNINFHEKIQNFFKKVDLKQKEKSFPLKKYFLSPLISALKSDIRKESKRHDYFNQLRISHLTQTFINLKRIKELNLKELKNDNKKLNLNLKKFTSKKNYFLILDLDETLVHISQERKNTEAIALRLDFCNEIVYLHKRPFLKEFLENLYKKFNLIIYTASQKNYADLVINCIDPENKYFVKRLYRQNCIVFDKNFIFKNIKVIKNLNLRKTIFIDNSIISLYHNKENSLQIIPFLGHRSDSELKTLDKFLRAIYYIKDFRKELLSSFRIDLILNSNTYDELVKLILSL